MIDLAQIKEPQAYKYLVSLERAEAISFDKDIYKIVTDFNKSDLKDYFKQQNQIIKRSMMFWLNEEDDSIASPK